MTSATFYEYVANVFFPWLLEKDIQFPVILFIDGHKSHYNIELYEFCVEHKIVLYCLYPNATYILQPCDVSIFRPLKVEWKEGSRRHKQRTSTPITRHNFCSIFKEAFDKACKPETIKNGFRACGLYPLNPDAVDYTKCISARRNEIFGKTAEIATHEDYRSALKVVEQFLGQVKITEFNRKFHLKEKDDENGEMYHFWKSCKINAAEKEESTKTDAIEQEHTVALENESYYEPIEIISESFLNSLPLQIDGVVYPTEYIVDIAPNETEVNIFDNVNDVLPLTEDVSHKDQTENDSNVILHDFTSDINDDNMGLESKNICVELLDMIIENALSTADVSKTGQTTVKKENKCGSEKKINIISNVVIGEKEGSNLNELWQKHLHWPKQEGQPKKPTVQAKLPFAITSNKWLEYHNEKEKRRIEKEDEMKEKKLKREMKKKEVKVKGTTKNKVKTENSVEDTEIKVTRQKRKRVERADDSDQEKENNTQKHLKTEDVQIVKGDYVVVKYQNKRYPGLIIDIEKEEYEISTMEQAKKERWKWPSVPDKIWYKKQNIVKKIPEPDACSGSDGYWFVNML